MAWQMSGGPAWATAAKHNTAAISAMANRGERICWGVMDFLISFRIVSTFRRLDVHKRRAVNSRTVKSLLAQLTWRLVAAETSRARRCARARRRRSRGNSTKRRASAGRGGGCRCELRLQAAGRVQLDGRKHGADLCR